MVLSFIIIYAIEKCRAVATGDYNLDFYIQSFERCYILVIDHRKNDARNGVVGFSLVNY